MLKNHKIEGFFLIMPLFFVKSDAYEEDFNPHRFCFSY